MSNKNFNLGQKVIVNTGGKDFNAIIDYPTIRKDINGKPFDYRLEYTNRQEDGSSSIEVSYLCRFTDQPEHTYTGGAVYGSHDARNYLAKSAQFIPEQYITPFVQYFGDDKK